MTKVDNISFKGKLVVGPNLSKNFKDSIPELSNMIKNKPYDVFIRGHFGTKGTRRKIITHFHADSYNYLSADVCRANEDITTNKTKHSSYKAAMEKLIEDMDNQMTQIRKNKKPLTFKEKLFAKFYELFLRAFYD